MNTPLRVLLVEDSEDDAALLLRELRRGGFQPTSERVDTPAAMADALSRQPWDVIVADYSMPRFDALAALQLLQQSGLDLPFLIVSGAIGEETAVAAMKAGAHDYIMKDRLARFIPSLQRELREAHGRRERKRAEEALHRMHEELETLVQRRTAELAKANTELQVEVGERKRLEKELRRRAQELTEADRRKNEYLAMLAHELRNPLAPVLNTLQILRLRDTGDPVVAPAHALIERQVRHMARLVDDLLDASRITRGKIQLRRQPVDLADLVARILDVTQPLIKARGHVLSVTLPQEPVRLEADPTRLEQILTNLLDNAAKYTEPGGQIWLTAEREGSDVLLRVRDNGVGMPPELLPRVFDLFAQGACSLDRSQGGLGIGLTLVRSLVEMHGGHVHASSPGPGLGSEFVVRLPALPQMGPAQPLMLPGKRPPVASSPQRRVLVVEDSVDTAETLAVLIKLWGSEVRVVHDGLAALEAANVYQPEVVLLDLGLPGMDGYQVARRLRSEEKLRGTLLVALSGYGQTEDRRRSREAGFDYHLTKPVEPEALQDLLGRPEAFKHRDAEVG